MSLSFPWPISLLIQASCLLPQVRGLSPTPRRVLGGEFQLVQGYNCFPLGNRSESEGFLSLPACLQGGGGDVIPVQIPGRDRWLRKESEGSRRKKCTCRACPGGQTQLRQPHWSLSEEGRRGCRRQLAGPSVNLEHGCGEACGLGNVCLGEEGCSVRWGL